MGRQFLENNIVSLIILFGIALVAGVGYAAWDTIFSSSQAQEDADYIQYEWTFNPTHTYAAGTFAPVALSNKAPDRLVVNKGTATAQIYGENGTAIAFAGTGPAFTLTHTAMSAAQCQDFLSSSVLSPFVTSIQVTGKSVETILPLGGDAAAADCAAGNATVVVTAKGRPGS